MNVGQLQIKLHQRINPDELKRDILIGLDSNILINLITHPMIGQYLDRKFNIFQKSKLAISEISKKEAMLVLRKKYQYAEADAKKELEKQINAFNIRVLSITENTFSIAKTIKIHYPDSLIIANFKENGVTSVFSIDSEFVRAARDSGLYSIKIPNAQKIQDIEYKRLFKRNNT